MLHKTEQITILSPLQTRAFFTDQQRNIAKIATFCLVFVQQLFWILAPVCKGAIISQLRVWPFPFAIIVAIGERSQNPGHLFTGAFNYMKYLSKKCIPTIIYTNVKLEDWNPIMLIQTDVVNPFSNPYLPNNQGLSYWCWFFLFELNLLVF